MASDNTAMLEALDRDLLVLQSVRIDSVHSLVTLMDQALMTAERVRAPALVLYGANERLIPWRTQSALLRRLRPDHRAVIYPQGHHTLLRDLNAAIVLDDLGEWITSGTDATWRRPEFLGRRPSAARRWSDDSARTS